jgi:CspA family cold shock protein
VRLCDAKEATGKIKAYNPIKGFGFVAGKDGAETLVHYSQVTDLGNIPTKLKKGDAVEFDVEPGEKGPRARNLRRAP